ncbi:Uncharacterised protein [Myroides odoratus]|nr:hypothetical protein Myrod_0207 [Myroides odoratus DSM 2801]EKB08319.1 hypothetical protein HMPREF9716_01138 [Myroides odoratus CIP 103059]STZ32083.1 Uncharacterised protein [Myroides odoratus]
MVNAIVYIASFGRVDSSVYKLNYRNTSLFNKYPWFKQFSFGKKQESLYF